jgi:hypothetical protein
LPHEEENDMKENGWARRTLRWMVVSCGVAAALPGEARAAVIKIACIGEQTTHSHSFPANGVGEYPWMLQMLLGAGYDTRNFGDCCATILQGYPKQPETHPYLAGSFFMPSVAFVPDIVVIGSWGKHDTEIANSLYAGVLDPVKLRADFDALVTSYLNLANHPKVYVSTPVPIPKGAPTGVTTNVILPAIRSVATDRNLPVVDLYPAFLNHPELYKDDTHVSDDAGLHKITDLVYAALMMGDDAGTPRPDSGGAADAGADTGGPAVDAGAGGSGGAGGTNSAGSSGAGGDGVAGAGQAGGGPASGGAGGGAGSGSTQGAGGTKPGVPGTDAQAGCNCFVSRVPEGRFGPSWLIVAAGALLVRRRRQRC